jgi:hypothetical protein
MAAMLAGCGWLVFRSAICLDDAFSNTVGLCTFA